MVANIIFWCSRLSTNVPIFLFFFSEKHCQHEERSGFGAGGGRISFLKFCLCFVLSSSDLQVKPYAMTFLPVCYNMNFFNLPDTIIIEVLIMIRNLAPLQYLLPRRYWSVNTAFPSAGVEAREICQHCCKQTRGVNTNHQLPTFKWVDFVFNMNRK